VPLDPARTVEELRELRELTGDENGAQRVAWTPVWVQAKEWLGGKLDGLPLEYEIDEAGNQWGPFGVTRSAPCCSAAISTRSRTAAGSTAV
jgi:hypothetical protein